MTDPFHSIDLTIEQTDEGCYGRILRSPAGQASSLFLVPFSPREIADMPKKLSESDASPNSLARHVGQTLFRAFFQGDLLNCYQESRQIAAEAQSLLRIRLHMHRLPAFDSLPWETLYDPTRDEFLALSSHSPPVRYIDQMHHILPLHVRHPMRMLVVIANPNGYPRFDADREWIRLLDSLDHLALDGKLILERLYKPTLLDLQRKLREQDYAILHIIGHGVFEDQMLDAHMVFEDEVGRSRFVSGQHLGALMRDHYGLRLVTLDGRGVRYAPKNPHATVAQEVVRRGIPAAIVLPPELSTAANLAFAQGCYAALADIQPVDQAVVAGRLLMLEEEQSEAWTLPPSRCVYPTVTSSTTAGWPRPKQSATARPACLEPVAY
ncbi:MAG: CHAT domain-containing protein [Caldilineaceae bacterium]|nr:CHAT domain-containing protein [Caldilineaceae bacterium]